MVEEVVDASLVFFVLGRWYGITSSCACVQHHFAHVM